MVNLDLEGTTVTLAVAQRPFETGSESGISNNFGRWCPSSSTTADAQPR